MADTVNWITYGGTTVNLTDGANYFCLFGRKSEWDTTFNIIEQDVPLQPGTRVKGIKTQVRDFQLPLLIKDTGDSTLKSRIRTLTGYLDPMLGDGHIQFEVSGVKRNLFCRYIDGLESPQDRGTGWAEFTLTFRATDPFWYDENDTQFTYYLTTSSVFFFPLFPLTLSSSSSFAMFITVLLGDVQSWPIWIIHGPGTSPLIRNQTTGKYISLTSTLVYGDNLVIDTRPGYKTVKLNGVNEWAKVSVLSSLFPFEVGSNTILAEITGATADTYVQMNYKNRYYSV